MYTVANISIALGLCSAAIIAIDLVRRPQQMTVMNVVWILSGLWSGIFGVWAYFAFGRNKTLRGVKMRSMDMKRPHWQSVALSTLHCGAGCTLADIVGELLQLHVSLTVGGSLLFGGWIMDYVLALAFGVGFQYLAIRQMNPDMRSGKVIGRAVKADFLSLTAWQVGMCAWMSLAAFVLFAGGGPSRDSAQFWFMMQIAMAVGFFCSYPVNAALIKYGVKSAM